MQLVMSQDVCWAMVLSLPKEALRAFVVAHKGYATDMMRDGNEEDAAKATAVVALLKQAVNEFYGNSNAWQLLLDKKYDEL